MSKKWIVFWTLRHAAGQVTATTIMMAPIALRVDRPWERVPTLTATWWTMLGLGVISTGVAYIIYFRLLTRVGATNLMLVTLLISVTALGLGFFWGRGDSAGPNNRGDHHCWGVVID